MGAHSCEQKEAGQNGRCLEGERVRGKSQVHSDCTRRKDPMTKRWMPALAFLIFATCLQAQSGYPQSDAGQAPSTNKPSGLTTLEGCLQYDNGQYSRIDAKTSHRLSGYSKQLKHHIGHEVELTGKPSSRTVDNTPAGGASSVTQQYVFEVKSVKHQADTCK